jgi:hypothetical protein
VRGILLVVLDGAVVGALECEIPGSARSIKRAEMIVMVFFIGNLRRRAEIDSRLKGKSRGAIILSFENIVSR